MVMHIWCWQTACLRKSEVDEIGTVFKFGGKEYTLNEQRKYDIPYGEDIFDIQFPNMRIGGE